MIIRERTEESIVAPDFIYRDETAVVTRYKANSHTKKNKLVL